jgi:hypothetical protein
MSQEKPGTDIRIPPGSAVVFEAPEEGREWTLRNTVHGLTFESEGQSLFRLTPKGPVIRGDVLVEGQVRREFDWVQFEGEWQVIEGDSGAVGNVAVIRRLHGNRFGLFHRNLTVMVQEMVFNPRTGTLDSLPDDPVERCISFWDRRSSGAPANRIFAMRRARGGASEGEIQECLYDWEGTMNNGTWGAEEGGG